jgi:Tol biopolymer transport system component
VTTFFLASAFPASATYPGQNGNIAFSAENKPTAEGPHGIGLFDVPSNTTATVKAVRELTSGDDYSVSYSADGQTIAFVRYPGGYVQATTQDLYVANADGSAPTLVLSAPKAAVGVESVALSPEGSRILFGHDGDLYAVDVDGMNLELVVDHAIYGQWSPDGTKIAYMHYGPSNVYDDSELYIANADGSDPVELDTGLSFSVGANWSPDGSKLVFSGPGKHFANDLYLINVDGSGFTRLTDTAQNEALAAWSPDGTMIVFTRSKLSGFTASLWKMNLATRKTKRIRTRFPRATAPDWQPIP